MVPESNGQPGSYRFVGWISIDKRLWSPTDWLPDCREAIAKSFPTESGSYVRTSHFYRKRVFYSSGLPSDGPQSVQSRCQARRSLPTSRLNGSNPVQWVHWRSITRRCQGSEIRERKYGLAKIPIDIQWKSTTIWLWMAWVQHLRLCLIQPGGR